VSDELQPVGIEHVKDHAFEKWGGRSCRSCGQAKTHPDHHGYPPSLNALGDGNRFAYRNLKVAWETRFLQLLGDTDLPHGLGRVTVEGVITFPTRARRDQGNYRFLLEKALGDALTAGGWLTDDDWTHYEFGGLQARYEKGVARTELLLFPSPAVESEAA
jgi:hypothetical protein